MSVFHCRIATLDGVVFDEDVTSLYVPASKGVLGILPNRLPIVASLKASKGELKVSQIDSTGTETWRYFVIKGGNLSAKRKESIVLTDSCIEVQSHEEASALINQ